MSSILFRNARLFDGLSDAAREGAQVLVQDDRIRQVGTQPIEAAGAEVIDLAGRTLMPGLIDAHYHAVAATPDLGKLADMPASLLHQHARKFLEASLQRGFTSIRDAGGADHGLAQAIEAGLIKGPRLFYSGKALTQTGGHGDFRSLEGDALCLCCTGASGLGRIADGITEVRRAARDELRKGATQIKIMASGGVASPLDPIHNLQYSEEEIRAIVWEAHSWGRYVMAHAYTPAAIRRCVEFGVRSIEHANLIDAEVAALCAERGAYVVPTLATYSALARDGRALGFPEVSLQKLETISAAGLDSLRIMKAAGVKMGLGTDLLGAMHAYEASEFTIRAEVLSPLEILKSATSINAALLQRSDDLGRVTEGALADLIVVEGDPLADVTILDGQGENVPLVMKGGEIFRNNLA